MAKVRESVFERKINTGLTLPPRAITIAVVVLVAVAVVVIVSSSDRKLLDIDLNT